MSMTREQAEAWAARFNERVPPGKDLIYEVEATERGWRVRARHAKRECKPGLRERYGEAVAVGLFNVLFWGAVLGGCAYLISLSDDSESSRVAGGGARKCHADYGRCLDPEASDYDCAGGSGNGPKYTGYVEVLAGDPFGLDADGDGVGCE
jgi:hypothetical protein